MPDVALYLFGPPRIERDGSALRIQRRKTWALLAYLAVTRRERARDVLAALMWPELDQRHAREALRHALAQVAEVLAEGRLQRSADHVVLPRDAGVWVDVERFHTLLAAAEGHDHPPSQPCDQCLAALHEAAGLYVDDFLAGYSPGEAPEFENWQTRQTESLRQELAGALERLVQAHTGRGEREQALAASRRWVALDPLCEPAQRALVRLLAEAGDRAAALRQYAECVSVLEAELGIRPEPETVQLAEQIRSGVMEQGAGAVPFWPAGSHTCATPAPPAGEQVPASGASAGGAGGQRPAPILPAPRHNLPPEPTPFVGRDVELALVAERLADPTCRLLTVVGPGGAGKSRLALRAAASSLDHFADGTYVVDLAPVASPDLLPSAMLRALPIPLANNPDPVAQLLTVLRNWHTLLVLDNFEHQLAGAGLLSELLRGAPRLKLLVTSRERLSLREEWLLPLNGLEVPPNEGVRSREMGDRLRAPSPDSTPPAADLPDLKKYSATYLFLACVRRLEPGYRPAQGDNAQIVRICRLLGGMPLGIELATARVRTVPLGAIATELARSLDLLATTTVGVPERQRSMQASFDHSWRLTSARAQSILAQLAVFRGGFTHEAAEAVAGATLADLAGLVDTSWLRLGPGMRYETHELVRQYCVGKLAEADGAAVRRRHAAYYASFWGEAARNVRLQPGILQTLAAELGNALAAWEWAVEAGEAEPAYWTLVGLRTNSLLCGLPDPALGVDAALARLKSRDDLDRRPDLVVLVSYLLQDKASRLFTQGLYGAARPYIEESLALLPERLGDLFAEMAWFLGRGDLAACLWGQGRFLESSRMYEAELAYLEERRAPDDRRKLTDTEIWYSQGQLVQDLTFSAWGLGLYDEAQSWAEQNPALDGRMGEWFRACALRHRALALHAQGAYAQAGALLRESLRTCQACGDPVNAAYACHHLGLVECATGRYVRARALFGRSLATARESNYLHVLCPGSLNGLGVAALALGQVEEARRRYRESLAFFGRPGATPGLFLASALVGLGQVALVDGNVELAQERFWHALGPTGRTAWETAQAIAGLAECARRTGGPGRAAALLAFVETWPGAWYETRRDAGQALRDLARELLPEQFAAATARGRARGAGTGALLHAGAADELVAELVSA